MKKQTQADMLLLVYALIMGVTSIILKFATQEFDLFNFIAIRFICAFTVCFILFWKQCKDKFNAEVLKHSVIVGLITYASHAFCTTGIAVTPIGIAGFLTSLQSIVIPIIAFFFLGQRIDRTTLFCVLGAFTGTALISIGNLEYSSGAWLCLGCSVFSGLQIIFIDKYVKMGDDGNAIMLGELGTMAVCAVIVAALTDGLSLPGNRFGWFAILWTGIVSTAVATYLQNYAQKYTTSVHTGIIFSTIPVFTLIGSRIVFFETFSLRAWLGALLMIACVICIELRHNNTAADHSAVLAEDEKEQI